MDIILNILKSYNYLGEKMLENGTLLIGRAPHLAPQAWLHHIYPPLNNQEIDELVKTLKVDIPESYKLFLKKMNGIKVFCTTFYLYGLRRNYIRDLNYVWQPFDITTPNILERQYNAKENMFFIGGYDWDGSTIYIDRITNKIHLCDRDNATSLIEWPTFDKMLDTEIKRLVNLFDKDGKQYDEEKTTLPN